VLLVKQLHDELRKVLFLEKVVRAGRLARDAGRRLMDKPHEFPVVHVRIDFRPSVALLAGDGDGGEWRL
jgi:hypothetical protein